MEIQLVGCRVRMPELIDRSQTVTKVTLFLRSTVPKNTSTVVLSIQNQSYIAFELSLHAADLVVENRLVELSVDQKLIDESTSSGSMNPLRNMLLPFPVFF
jgi:hypothetical protein